MTTWPFVSLGEVFDVARGGSPRPIDSFLTDDPGGVNWVMIGDAPEGSKYITGTRKRIRSEGVSRSRRIKPGDFLLTNSMSFGRPYISKIHGCIHDGWLVLSPREEIWPDFFYHLIGSKKVYAEFVRQAAGATVKNLNIDLVRSVKVAVPPLSEQRRIAEILDRADALRAKRRASLEHLDALTQSIFLEMFDDPSSGKRWPPLSLGDCTETIQIGPFGSLLHAEDYVAGGIPLINPKHIQDGRICADVSESVTSAKYEELGLYSCRKGDVVMGRRGEMGRTAVVGPAEDGFLCGTGSLIIRPKPDRVTCTFLALALSRPSSRRRFEAECRGITMPNLNQGIVSSFTIAVPPIALQREFDRRLGAIRSLVASGRVSLRSLDALFASLQHRAFNGTLWPDREILAAR